MEARLKAKILVSAIVRACGTALIPAYVVRRGDADSGAVLVVALAPGGTATVFQVVFDGEGARLWQAVRAGVAAAEADAFAARQAEIDEDLWIVEVEAPEGWTPAAVTG